MIINQPLAFLVSSWTLRPSKCLGLMMAWLALCSGGNSRLATLFPFISKLAQEESCFPFLRESSCFLYFRLKRFTRNYRYLAKMFLPSSSAKLLHSTTMQSRYLLDFTIVPSLKSAVLSRASACSCGDMQLTDQISLPLSDSFSSSFRNQNPLSSFTLLQLHQRDLRQGRFLRDSGSKKKLTFIFCLLISISLSGNRALMLAKTQMQLFERFSCQRLLRKSRPSTWCNRLSVSFRILSFLQLYRPSILEIRFSLRSRIQRFFTRLRFAIWSICFLSRATILIWLSRFALVKSFSNFRLVPFKIHFQFKQLLADKLGSFVFSLSLLAGLGFYSATSLLALAYCIRERTRALSLGSNPSSMRIVVLSSRMTSQESKPL